MITTPLLVLLQTQTTVVRVVVALMEVEEEAEDNPIAPTKNLINRNLKPYYHEKIHTLYINFIFCESTSRTRNQRRIALRTR